MFLGWRKSSASRPSRRRTTTQVFQAVAAMSLCKGPSGDKHVPGLIDGFRESTHSRRERLLDLKHRGMQVAAQTGHRPWCHRRQGRAVKTGTSSSRSREALPSLASRNGLTWSIQRLFFNSGSCLLVKSVSPQPQYLAHGVALPMQLTDNLLL